jgi:hypothetical protein
MQINPARSSELHRTNASAIPHPIQFQLLKLLTPRVEVNSTHRPNPLVKANIIEALKARSTDTFHPMIWHEKQLFPSHEQVGLAEVVL